MESRYFIAQANLLIKRIRDNELVASIRDSVGGPDVRQQTQKDIYLLFASLQNPTLPTAYRLRDVAFEHGYAVDPRVLNRLDQFDRYLG